jgi:hypothetical protein
MNSRERVELALNHNEPDRVPVLAEKYHPLKEHLVSPHNPKGLFILSGGFSNGCAFSASTL